MSVHLSDYPSVSALLAQAQRFADTAHARALLAAADGALAAPPAAGATQPGGRAALQLCRADALSMLGDHSAAMAEANSALADLYSAYGASPVPWPGGDELRASLAAHSLSNRSASISSLFSRPRHMRVAIPRVSSKI
jgi:hypothetical protein